MSPEITKEEKIFSFLVVFMALLHVYHPPSIPVSFGEILMFLFIPIYFKQGMRFPFEKQEMGFVLFFFYMAFSSLIMGIVFDAPMSKYFSVARSAFYWVLIFYFGKNLFNRMIFEKWMLVFSVTLSCFILVQYSVYALTGFFIPGLIPGLPINNGGESGAALYEHSLYLASFRGFIRPHGFLAEPAFCAQFLFIAMITLICNGKIFFSKKIALAILFSVAILATQSTTGLLLFGAAWLLFISIEKKLSIFRLPLIILLMATFFYVFFSAEDTMLWSVERAVNIVNASGLDGSSEVRLNNGMNLFSELPFIFKLFGTGAGLSEYVFDNLGFRDANSYMNVFAGILFNTGIIGGGIWITSLIIMFSLSGLLGKSLVVGFLLMSLGCSFYCQPQMVWFFLLILADINEKKEKYFRRTSV